jgi:acyl CoA:acetate/3-ketoacid CoA transferase beta subunit
MVLRETLGGATVEEIQECTEAEFTVAEDLLKGAAE